ncbi:hypothetical protein IGI04_030530 [Brassica rapa subsp. trilocularis]|uniref:Uncharacterized protein n=1 Tax=Brassica rapa subsp. trilocularis TaxID=1813537 RepID=A0ABQ7LR11_BRACM|nr:hypothetical protein IGI04_030530 [Brassica rapa subsp. trilocularis]
MKRFYRKALRKDIFTRITFRKNVHAGLYGLSDIDFVVTDFDLNRVLLPMAFCMDVEGRLRVVISFPQCVNLRDFLKTFKYWQRDKFWDLVSGCLILCLEMLDTSALVLGQDLGLLLVLEGAMTNSSYVSRFSFILIPYRFKVRDRFSAYTTCMRYYPCVRCTLVISTRWLSLFRTLRCFYRGRKFRQRTNLHASAMSRDAEDLLFFRMPRFVLEMFAGLKIFRDVARLTTNVRSQNCCSCLDANSFIYDRGIMIEVSMFRIALEALLRIFPYMPHIMVKVAWSYSWSVTESQNVFHRFFERILMTHSFLERIGQPEVDLANPREESAPFNVHDATSISSFLRRKCFRFFSVTYLISRRNFSNETGFLKPEKASILWLIVEFQFDIEVFEVWEYTSIVYVPTPPPLFFYERKRLNRYFEGLCTFLLLMFGMIDNSGRFIDDAWTVIWLFPRSELDMRGDRFSTFGEFRSVCKIWMNNYGTIYRDRKNRFATIHLGFTFPKVLWQPQSNFQRKFQRRFDRDLKENTKLEVRASRSKRRSLAESYLFLSLKGCNVASRGSDRLLRSEWKQARKSPTCFRRKISTETPIETKRKAFR